MYDRHDPTDYKIQERLVLKMEIWSHAERNAQNPVFRRYFEMKHALNGVSYAADVYAPRKA